MDDKQIRTWKDKGKQKMKRIREGEEGDGGFPLGGWTNPS